MMITQKQIDKMNTIIAKLERLQYEIDDRNGAVSAAKSRLIDVLRGWENGK